MYTLPAKTRITIRRPTRALQRLLAPAFLGLARERRSIERLSVELTDWVNRDPDPIEESRRLYRWYSFATGVHSDATGSVRRPFEIEPEYALLMRRGSELVIYLNAFSVEPDAVIAMDVARDAILEGRIPEAERIARTALPHGHALFLALVQKERNLLALT